MNKLIFCLVDGLSGLRRSELSSLLTILTVSISLFLIGAFYVISNNVLTNLGELRSRVVFEAFLNDSLDVDGQQMLGRRIRTLRGIDSLKFIDKNEALRIFKSTFDSKYSNLIDDNPLPASFQIFLQPHYLVHDSARALEQQIEALPGVDDVVYRGEVLQALDRYFDTVIAVLLAMGIGLGLLSFVLVSTNISLTIAAKRRIIETMELVGAARIYVRGPFVVQGMAAGLIGGVLAGLYTYLAIQVTNMYLGNIVMTPRYTYAGLLILGVLYGFLGSLNAIRGRFSY